MSKPDPFANLADDARVVCRAVAGLLDDNKNDEAKAQFQSFCKSKGLVYWETIALADYVATQRKDWKGNKPKA